MKISPSIIRSTISILFSLLLLDYAIAGNDDLDAFEDHLKRGEVVQECGIACMLKWGFERTELKKLNDEGKWLELAYKTAKVKYKHELAYYYLAKASLNLGHLDGAMTYIERANENVMICLPSTCDGIDIKDDFKKFREEISSAKMKQAKVAKDPQPSEVIKPANQSSPSQIQNIDSSTISNVNTNKFDNQAINSISANLPAEPVTNNASANEEIKTLKKEWLVSEKSWAKELDRIKKDNLSATFIDLETRSKELYKQGYLLWSDGKKSESKESFIQSSVILKLLNKIAEAYPEYSNNSNINSYSRESKLKESIKIVKTVYNINDSDLEKELLNLKELAINQGIITSQWRLVRS